MHHKSILVRTVSAEPARLYSVRWELDISEQAIQRAAEKFGRLRPLCTGDNDKEGTALIKLALLCVLDAVPDGTSLVLEDWLSDAVQWLSIVGSRDNSRQ